MVMKEKVILSWSGGKDSAFALHELQKAENYEISALLTTITEDYDRISMHGVRRALLERQADSLGFPLEGIHFKEHFWCPGRKWFFREPCPFLNKRECLNYRQMCGSY